MKAQSEAFQAPFLAALDWGSKGSLLSLRVTLTFRTQREIECGPGSGLPGCSGWDKAAHHRLEQPQPQPGTEPCWAAQSEQLGSNTPYSSQLSSSSSAPGFSVCRLERGRWAGRACPECCPCSPGCHVMGRVGTGILPLSWKQCQALPLSSSLFEVVLFVNWWIPSCG